MTTYNQFWHQQLYGTAVLSPDVLIPPTDQQIDCFDAIKLIASVVSPDEGPGQDLEQTRMLIWQDATGDPQFDQRIAKDRDAYAKAVYADGFAARVTNRHGSPKDFLEGASVMVHVRTMQIMHTLLDGKTGDVNQNGLPTSLVWHHGIQQTGQKQDGPDNFYMELAMSAIGAGEWQQTRALFADPTQNPGQSLTEIIDFVAENGASAQSRFPAILARDYLGALKMYLPDNMIPDGTLDHALERVNSGRQADLLRDKYPPVEAAIVAAQRRIKSSDVTPRPTPPQP